MRWIEKNVGDSQRVMSKDCLEITFYTGKICFITPSEKTETVAGFAEEREIDYIAQKKSESRIFDSAAIFEDDE